MRGERFLNKISEKFNILETTREFEDQITILVDRNDLPSVVKYIYYDIGAYLTSVAGNDERPINKHFALYYVLSVEGGKLQNDEVFSQDEKCFITVRTLIPANEPTFPSVTPFVPACVWYERELYDMFGLVAEGLPDKRRLVLSDDWPEDLFPLRKDSMNYNHKPEVVKLDSEPEFNFIEPSGEDLVNVPLGPLHITNEEPGHFRLYCDGDTIVDADYRLFYIHRGMEKLAENRMNYDQMGYLAERICGICGYAHSIACIEAAERAAGIEIPKRAQALRVAFAEIERLHSHLLNIGLACEATGNWTAFMHIFKIREYTMQLAELVTGGRKTYGNVIIGGLRRDITGENIKKSLKLLDDIELQTKEIWDAVMDDKRQVRRWKGVGVLPTQIARDFSPVGPTIRGCGIARDFRFDHPYDFYKEIDFKPSVCEGGDVFARVNVRYLDTISSINIIRQCLSLIPNTAIKTNATINIKPGKYALGYTEAPRGDATHWLMQGGAQKVYRWKARASTYANWPSLKYQLRGNVVADAALIICSLDPCFSCTERVIITDIKSKKSKVLGEKEFKALCQKKD